MPCMGCMPDERINVASNDINFPISFDALISKQDLNTISKLKGKTNEQSLFIGEKEYLPMSIIFEKFVSSKYDSDETTFEGKLFFSFNRKQDIAIANFTLLINKII